MEPRKHKNSVRIVCVDTAAGSYMSQPDSKINKRISIEHNARWWWAQNVGIINACIVTHWHHHHQSLKLHHSCGLPSQIPGCLCVCVWPILQFINHTQFVISQNHLFRSLFLVYFSSPRWGILWLYSNCVFSYIFEFNSCISLTRSLCYYLSLHTYTHCHTHKHQCLLAGSRARSFVIYKRDFLCGNLEARNQLYYMIKKPHSLQPHSRAHTDLSVWIESNWMRARECEGATHSTSTHSTII